MYVIYVVKYHILENYLRFLAIFSQINYGKFCEFGNGRYLLGFWVKMVNQFKINMNDHFLKKFFNIFQKIKLESKKSDNEKCSKIGNPALNFIR